MEKRNDSRLAVESTSNMKQYNRLHGLYVITPAVDHDTDPNHSSNLLRQVELALSGGASIVQYRDKSTDHERRLAEASQLLTLCNSVAATFIINDDVELAATIGAHGVHLGGEDMTIQAARQCLGAQAIVGASCYNRIELALSAQQHGADYVAFGRFFPSRTKPHAVQAGVDLLINAKSRLAIPIVAIGGITAQNGGQLVHAGATMLAVVDAVFAQKDIRQAARQLSNYFL